MYREHTSCRACGSTKLVPVFDLGIQPLANDFRAPGDERNGFAPLRVLLCPECTLAQLSVVVDPAILYDHYPYVTSTSQTMKNHFDRLSNDLLLENGVGSVVEIGSNDGLFLDHLHLCGWKQMVGIDPAINLADTCAKRGIRSVVSLFDEDAAKDTLRMLSQVDTIVARHVFAHIDNWKEFVRCVELLSHRDTLLAIEVPYVAHLIDRCEWDTIYHEHLSYVSVRAVVALLEKTQLHIHKVKWYPVHGGSIVFFIRRNDYAGKPDSTVQQYLDTERAGVEEWRKFDRAALDQRMKMMALVEDLVQSGKTVCGFGASAKSTVAINAIGLTDRHVRFITDTTPMKQGRFSPGSFIKIVPETELLNLQPEYAICFAWNFREEILERNAEYRKRGGKFIFFVPSLEVI